MDKNYKTILNYGQDEIFINKSQFIGYAKPVKNEEEALAFIEEIKTKHKDATHNVYAYALGKTSNVQRFSDDGEPSGTAGIPVLEVIKKEELRDIVVVATRYFGGVKLGAGGLIRAYTKTAKIGIDAGKIVNMVLHKNIKVRMDYTSYGKVENYINNENYIVSDSVYDDKVNTFVYVQLKRQEEFINTITNLTSGEAIIEVIDERYIPMRIK